MRGLPTRPHPRHRPLVLLKSLHVWHGCVLTPLLLAVRHGCAYTPMPHMNYPSNRDRRRDPFKPVHSMATKKACFATTLARNEATNRHPTYEVFGFDGRNRVGKQSQLLCLCNRPFRDCGTNPRRVGQPVGTAARDRHYGADEQSQLSGPLERLSCDYGTKPRRVSQLLRTRTPNRRYVADEQSQLSGKRKRPSRHCGTKPRRVEQLGGTAPRDQRYVADEQSQSSGQRKRPISPLRNEATAG